MDLECCLQANSSSASHILTPSYQGRTAIPNFLEWPKHRAVHWWFPTPYLPNNGFAFGMCRPFFLKPFRDFRSPCVACSTMDD